ncbi:MAG: HAMP domain-containing sensor histidine kinase [Pseudomonadota bacterium]
MPKTLYGRLVAALLLLFGVTGIVFLVILRLFNDLYYKEVMQTLNGSIAMYVVAEEQLISAGEVNSDALSDLATTVMLVNPSVEVYLLDASGAIIGHAAPDEKLRRRRVDLGPLRTFIDAKEPLPILGDDPRSDSVRKVFSAAPVMDGEQLQGYLYAVLGGEQYESVSQTFRASHIRRVSLWAIAVTIAFAAATGLFVVFALTRRLRELIRGVQVFKDSDFHTPVAIPAADPDGDEIDRLTQSFNDMSERIAAQIEERDHIDQLRRELITNISHDLRTPLASMQGYIETLLLKEGTMDPAEQRDYLEIATRHGEQLGRLVEQLFELSRLQSDGVQPVMEPFSLAELLQDVAQQFQLAASNKDVRLQAALQPGLPFVLGDISLIERVLENIIENAVRHTPGGGTIRISLSAPTDEEGTVAASQRVKVQIANTGSDIPEDELPHIFERYYRVDPGADVGGPLKKRTGLGLAIVKRILELHNAPITVTSSPAQGTRFTFTLPVC